MNEENLPKNYSRKVLVLVIILSLVFGAGAGVISGAVTSLLLGQGPLVNWPSFNIAKSGSDKNKGQSKGVYQPVAGSEEDRLVTAASKVQPSVVSIIISKELTQNSNFPFDYYFPGFNIELPNQGSAPSTEKQQVGGGTGFIISEDGLILTNKHVVADSEAEYTVILNDGKTKYTGKVVDVDPFNDFGIIKIDAKGLTPVKLGDSDKIKIGQTVIAIGNALSELPNTVTKGIVSGLSRQITASGGLAGAETLKNVIQTDAAINPGNSGGPLINLEGEAIGINTAVSNAGQLIGFAIPINEAKKAVDSVVKTGKIIRPFLGVRYSIVTPEMAKKNNLTKDYGAIILRGQAASDLAVVPGSPADKAGLVENDIILEVDSVKIDETNDLGTLIGKHAPGDEVSLKILHKGEEKTVKVKLEEYKQ